MSRVRRWIVDFVQWVRHEIGGDQQKVCTEVRKIEGSGMNSVMRIVLSEVLTLAKANEQTVLAGLSGETANLESVVQKLVAEALSGIPGLSMFSGMIEGAVQAALPKIVAEAGSEEKVLFDMAIAALQKEIAGLN